MKDLLIILVLLLAVSILAGCTSTIEVPKEVKVPVKCQVTKTTPPIDTGDVELNNKHILIYTEILKRDLDFCTDGIIKEVE